jgi:hypothetical protein
MSKYYTPEIEEFYVGFEFFVENTKYTLGTDSKDVISFFAMNMSRKVQVSDNVKVKYLDKEDIESLGFTFDKTSTTGQWKFFKDNLCLYYRPETRELGTFTIDPSKNDFFSEYNRDNKMVSFLIVKNKSELKKLLKQLNIK